MKGILQKALSSRGLLSLRTLFFYFIIEASAQTTRRLKGAFVRRGVLRKHGRIVNFHSVKGFAFKLDNIFTLFAVLARSAEWYSNCAINSLEPSVSRLVVFPLPSTDGNVLLRPRLSF